MGWKEKIQSKGRKKGHDAQLESQRPRPPRGATTFPRGTRQRWHQDLQNSQDVISYLETGSPSLELLNFPAFKEATTDYLRNVDIATISACAKNDDILDNLIDEYSRSFPSTKDAATIACLHEFSEEQTASQHVRALLNTDAIRYLRCIAVSQHISQYIVPRTDVKVTQSLLEIFDTKEQHLQRFGQLIRIVHMADSIPFIPLHIIHSALTWSSIKPYLQAQLDLELKEQRFMTVLGLISWLQELSNISGNPSTISILDAHFPAWRWLTLWRANCDRLDWWERGEFTVTQRRKVAHIIELDGPVKAAEESCYDELRNPPRSAETTEILLQNLYRAANIGPGAVDLFVHLCVDNVFDDTATLILEEALEARSDILCCGLLLMLQAIGSKSSLSARMNLLVKALAPFKPDHTSTQLVLQFSNQYFGAQINEVILSAQREFRSQLRTGSGEYIGTLLYNLGRAVLQFSSIHSSMPAKLLPLLQQFPPKDALDAIFDQIREHDDFSNPEETRFKSYLGAVLGGVSEYNQGTITLATIQQEIEFWRRHPDSERVGLAKTLAKAQCIDYTLYTTCLRVMLEEDSLFITDMKQKISLENGESCLNFAKYLARRRRLNQLQHDCWLLVFVALLNDQDPTFLSSTARKMGVDKWIEITREIMQLLSPVVSRLPADGDGLSQERFRLWHMLQHNSKSITFLTTTLLRGRGDAHWLYFPTSVPQIMYLLDILKRGEDMDFAHHQILAYLSVDGRNLSAVCECIQLIEGTSVTGQAVLKRSFGRLQQRQTWHPDAVAISLQNWIHNENLMDEDVVLLESLAKLLKLPVKAHRRARPDPVKLQIACQPLQLEYEKLMERAKTLETLRLRHRNKDSDRLAALLQRLRVENPSGGRSIEAEIPADLIDSVEAISTTEYELSFALTSLHDLQRKARGIPAESRLLLVRAILTRSSRYCISFQHDGGPQHTCKLAEKECPGEPCLFGLHLSNALKSLPQKVTLQAIHATAQKGIVSSPETCLMCAEPMSVKLWKPSVCSKKCSLRLRSIPLKIRLHQLLVDPLSIDLLLTCLYGSAGNSTLTPGCPIAHTSLKAVIDSFPPLVNLQSASDLQAAIRGKDSLGKSREDLLSWICLHFRGFMLSAPDGYKVPSMPQTIQFLVPNSHHERERSFRQKMSAGAGSGPVFHGTSISRLFLILSEGLKNVTGTKLEAHGHASGPGVYCGEEQLTSTPYAGSTGQSWRHSALSNMAILLGCELQGYVSTPVHVVPDHDRLLVRYVFLLPAGFNPPPRRHVDQAMTATFSRLRLTT